MSAHARVSNVGKTQIRGACRDWSGGAIRAFLLFEIIDDVIRMNRGLNFQRNIRWRTYFVDSYGDTHLRWGRFDFEGRRKRERCTKLTRAARRWNRSISLPFARMSQMLHLMTFADKVRKYDRKLHFFWDVIPISISITRYCQNMADTVKIWEK